MPKSLSPKTRVLFLNSPLVAGADTWIHFLLLRSLSRERFELHAAGQPATEHEPSPAYESLRAIPDLRLRATNFGPSLFGHSARQKLGAALRALPAAASLLALAGYIRRHRIEILHSTDRPRDALACATLSAMTGAKAVIHVHVKFDDWIGPSVRWAFGRAHALLGVSEFVRGSLVSRGYRAERVHAVLNAIDPKAWNPGLDPAPGRQSLRVPPGAPLIVSVARLFHWKGHAELIRAFATVHAALRQSRLAIVGADYPEGSGVAAELQALARDLGVADHVIFTGQRSDIAALLAACDVFALPSFEEPFGLVFAEAMAMKRPVVALNNGGTPEVVRDGVTGLLAPPGDVERIAAQLLSLLCDPALRARMGEAGRREVEARFTPERLASDVARVYDGLCPRAPNLGGSVL